MDERTVFWSLAWAQAVSAADLAGVEPSRAWPRWDPVDLWATIDRGRSNAPRIRRAIEMLRTRPVPPIPEDVVLRCDPCFPEPLRHVHAPPFALWVRGDRSLLQQRPAVAMVGARKARRDSIDVARTLGAACAAAGIPVVSGLAIGIDAASHRGVADAGGRAVAVLPSSVDEPYPSANRSLADSVLANGGLLVSEHAPFEPACKRFFPARNRIIAALADLVVVIQAAQRSGTATTVRYAAELGVEVGVVPSFIGDVAYASSLELLRDGARSIVDLQSMLLALGLHRDLADPELSAGIEPGEAVTLHELAMRRGVAASGLALELVELELAGVVRREPDGRYTRA